MIDYSHRTSTAVPTPADLKKLVPYRAALERALSAPPTKENSASFSGTETPSLRVGISSTAYSLSRLEETLSRPAEDFSQMLLRLAEERGLSQVDLYKGAGVARQIFYRIRTDVSYKPAKATTVSFALSLQLDLSETLELMARAGYTLSPAHRWDLIIRFFIENEVYDPAVINAALYEHDLPTLLSC